MSIIRKRRTGGIGGNVINYAHHEPPALSVSPTLLVAVLRLGLPYIQRTWGTSYRGALYLHGSAWQSRADHERAMSQIRVALPSLSPARLPSPANAQRFKGRLACSVELLDCEHVPARGVYLWRLGTVRELLRPVLAQGHQILWPLSRGCSAEGLAALGLGGGL